MANSEKNITKKKVLFAPNESPKPVPLVLFSLQHMLMMLSIGLALPVTVSRVAGLDPVQSAILLAASLFSMGLTTILQSLPGKFIGSGYQSFSTCDTASITCCVLAAELGGIPLVLGMSIFAALLRFTLGSFSHRLRKLFAPDVIGTMLFILGINLIPTAFKYFLGTSGEFDPMHLLVACVTLLSMLVCTFFVKPMKPYAGLVGMAFGYILSWLTGILDISAFETLSKTSFVALPVYTEFKFSFDARMILPFAIVAIANVVDNIGDFSACQAAASDEHRKIDWKSVEGGTRGNTLGSALFALIGGTLQATATANIGFARSSGVASRSIAYLSGGFLIVIACFPVISGTLAMIPEPVLGAVIMYAMCYMMDNGFSSLQSIELDDRKIFTIFLSFGAAVSTLIPGLYSFLPDTIENSFASPLVMGLTVLIITTLISRIGLKKTQSFSVGVKPEEVEELNRQIVNTCGQWGAPKTIARKLEIGISGFMEGLYAIDSEMRIHLTFAYDSQSVKINVVTDPSEQIRTGERESSEQIKTGGQDSSEQIKTDAQDSTEQIRTDGQDSSGIVSNRIYTDKSNQDRNAFEEDEFNVTIDVAVAMLRNMFDNVKMIQKENKIVLDIETDIE